MSTQDTQSPATNLVRWLPVVFFFYVLLSRTVAFQSWWCLDDWGLLARATGNPSVAEAGPARWLSQQAYWSLTYPLFGLGALSHAFIRVALHALAVAGLVRIGRRLNLTPWGLFVSALLFASTPTAFTILAWGAGVQELLAGASVIWALSCWLAGGRRDLMAALVLGAVSIFAKESGLGLPLFMLGHLWWRRRQRPVDRFALAVAGALGIIALLEISLVLNHFQTGTAEAYAMGGGRAALINLGTFGWWLATPTPIFTAEMSWSRMFAGLAVWGVWLVVGVIAWRRGNRVPLLALAGAVLSLGPALPLISQARPYLAYVAAAALALAVGALLRLRAPLTRWPVAAICLLGIVLVHFSMEYRWNRLDINGHPADPVRRGMEFSRQGCEAIAEALADPGCPGSGPLIILQIPPNGPASARRGQPAPPVIATARYRALGGILGPSLVAGAEHPVDWSTSLLEAGAEARVCCETAGGFMYWGKAWRGLINAALVDLLAGRMDVAVLEILRAAALEPHLESYRIPQDAMQLPLEPLSRRLQQFAEGLQAGKSSIPLSQEEGRVVLEFVTTLLGQVRDLTTAIP